MELHGIKFDSNYLADFCRRHHVRRLSLFGSILTSDFGPMSDIDMLVEFEPAALVDLFDIAGMELELAETLGRPVDVRTAQDLSKYFRKDVVQGAKLLHAA